MRATRPCPRRLPRPPVPSVPAPVPRVAAPKAAKPSQTPRTESEPLDRRCGVHAAGRGEPAGRWPPELTPACQSAMSARAARAAGLRPLLARSAASRGGAPRRGRHPTPGSRPLRRSATHARPFPIRPEQRQSRSELGAQPPAYPVADDAAADGRPYDEPDAWRRVPGGQGWLVVQHELPRRARAPW